MSQPSTIQTGHLMPELSRDYSFFLEGLRQRQLLVQRCSACSALRHPPSPACPECHCLEWTPRALQGGGRIYSYIVHHHPPIPPYTSPHVVVLVDMDEGSRVLAALEGCAIDQIAIGLRVRVEFVEIGENFVLHRFRPEGEL